MRRHRKGFPTKRATLTKFKLIRGWWWKLTEMHRPWSDSSISGRRQETRSSLTALLRPHPSSPVLFACCLLKTAAPFGWNWHSTGFVASQSVVMTQGESASTQEGSVSSAKPACRTRHFEAQGWQRFNDQPLTPVRWTDLNSSTWRLTWLTLIENALKTF